jgi:hypothetical protein
MLKTLGFVVSTTVLLSACGQGKAPQNSESKAIVSSAQAEEAFEIVKSIDYIPFNYIVDGCYARSLYMSMELAAQGIPSSAHYIYGYLLPTDDVSWSYHVAPLLKISGQEAWILDPAFEVEPLRLSAWIKKNNSQGRYSTEVKAGSAYFDQTGRTSEFDASHLIQNFQEMPTFLTSDIASACTTMYNYIPEQNQSSAQSRAQRAKLLTQTQVLVGALDELGKLENDGGSFDANSACERAVGL